MNYAPWKTAFIYLMFLLRGLCVGDSSSMWLIRRDMLIQETRELGRMASEDPFLCDPASRDKSGYFPHDHTASLECLSPRMVFLFPGSEMAKLDSTP